MTDVFPEYATVAILEADLQALMVRWARVFQSIPGDIEGVCSISFRKMSVQDRRAIYELARLGLIAAEADCDDQCLYLDSGSSELHSWLMENLERQRAVDAHSSSTYDEGDVQSTSSNGWLRQIDVVKGFGWDEGAHSRKGSMQVKRLCETGHFETNNKKGKGKRISFESVMKYAKNEKIQFTLNLDIA
ncbi:hypothetical protein [Fuerstiella marisgermanici]|uniref:Uncharacterized protein n=1 Tax=Fuerstiella marisgermanici TaxID=1891926 RepID=A0A1P8WBU8_9PLAN|nr:hypothetical protein [Fuerstiella marisgermanici]APZ91549.1 hypothetical protein Fuma_01138 [Fuerstiella marisgermanici]